MNILKKWIGADQVDDTKILLRNDQYLRGRNAANSGNINLLKVNASDIIEFASLPQYSGSPFATQGYVGTQLGNYIASSEKGANNGVATLDGTGKVPAAQLPNSVMEFKGMWDASSNTPTLADGTGNPGDVYLVSVAGTQDLGSGPIAFDVNDFLIYNGSIWQKSGSTGANTALSNLTSPTSVNQDLLPAGDEGVALGATDHRWANAYIGGLVDSGGFTQISLDSRVLNDATAAQSMNWNVRELYASDGSTTMIQYNDESVGVMIGRDLLPVQDNVNSMGGASNRWVNLNMTGSINSGADQIMDVTGRSLFAADGTRSIDFGSFTLTDDNNLPALTWGDGDHMWVYSNSGSGHGKTVRFSDSTNTTWFGLRAAESSDNTDYILPAADAAGALTSDGAGNLTWVPAGTGNLNQDLSNLTAPTKANADINSEILDTILVNYGAQEPNTGISTAFGATNSKVAVQFTVGSTTLLNAIEAWIAGTPRTGSLQASIYTDSAGSPGSVVTTSEIVDASTISYGTDWTRFRISRPNDTYSLASGTYWIVLETSGGPLSGDVSLFQSSSHPAPGNTFVYNGSWSDDGQPGMAVNVDRFTTHNLGTAPAPWATVFAQNITSSKSAVYSDPLNMFTADVSNGTQTGMINIFTGAGTLNNGSSGGMYLSTGDGGDSSTTGEIALRTGSNAAHSSGGATGNISLTSGNSDQGGTGQILFTTGDVGSGNGNAGGIQFAVGATLGVGNSNGIAMNSGSAVDGNAGLLQLIAGNILGSGTAGSISIQAGNAMGSAVGTPGQVAIQGGNSSPSASAPGGNVLITGGSGNANNAGDVIISGGDDSGPGVTGNVILQPGQVTGGGATSGAIKFDRSGAVVGYIWTATNVDGSGQWMANAGSGGATQALDNLAAVMINDVLNFGTGVTGIIKTNAETGATSSTTMLVQSGATVDGNSAGVQINSGDVSGNGNSGGVDILSGAVAGTGDSGSINLTTAVPTSGARGSVSINTRILNILGSSGDQGSEQIRVGAVGGQPGETGFAYVSQDASAGNTSDQLQFYSGSGVAAGSSSGGIFIASSGGDINSGAATLQTGDSAGTSNGVSGALYIKSGNVGAGSGVSGSLFVNTGSTVDGNSGDMLFVTGIPSGTGTRGSIGLTAFSVFINNGPLFMQSAPIYNYAVSSGFGSIAGPTQGGQYYENNYGKMMIYTGTGADSGWGQAGPFEWNTETFTLSSTDITNQYVDLAHYGRGIIFIVKGANSIMMEGASYDFTVTDSGSASRINFQNDIATGGPSALVAGDIVQFKYVW